jgi:methylase of polypeptide subunit release factors
LTGVILQAMGAFANPVNSRYDRPPLLSGPAEFAAARRVFQANGYSYENLCARLGVERLYQFHAPPPAELFAQPVEDALAVLIRLFCYGLHIRRETVERFLSVESRAALCALRLLEADPEAPEMNFAPAIVFPFLDVLAASDRFCTPAGETIEVAADAVYPALFDNTYNFVTRLPETPCEALLDLGCGGGAAAIRQSRFARQVWAADITARAVYFAEFNSRLNGRENVETVEGDLYAPVRGLTFDRIVTQPPYIAAETDKITYRDGGKDGEQIFRRIVEGLPRFLRPGGTCYALLMATDREGEAFEQRIRRWLGESAGDFDIAMVCDVAQDPVEFLRNAQKIAREEKEYRRILYRETKTSAVLYGSVAIRRKLEPGPPVVAARAFAGKTLSGNDLDFLLKWTAAVAAPGGTEMLWNARPALGAHCELVVHHRVRDGKLAAEDFELRTAGPFASRGRTPAWAAEIVAECDGTRTWGERCEKRQAEGGIPPGVTRDEFTRMLAILVSTGVLKV